MNACNRRLNGTRVRTAAVMVQDARMKQGTIDYLDARGYSRGRERFAVGVEADGRRTLQVWCEIDATRLVRHVVQTVDREFRPLEAAVRVSKDGRAQASGWLRFTPGGVELHACDAAGTLRRRSIALERPARAFGTHPLCVDGWMGALFALDGPPVQRLTDAFVSSYEFDGSGTVDCLPIEFGLEYRGIETVVTAAGRFRCHHFRYLLEGSAITHPPYETWVTTDGEFTLVRALAGAPLDYRYELTNWQ
ncbi:MAG: hypothetical protein U1F11_05835 [Steroidobacteraceae bacterium]